LTRRARVQELLANSNGIITATVTSAQSLDSWFNAIWMYVTVAFANVTFSGLLSIHTLLDHPYGNDCCKFPLRAQITEVLNATRALLARADELPSMFADVFGGDGGSDKGGDTGDGVSVGAAQAQVCPCRMPPLCNWMLFTFTQMHQRWPRVAWRTWRW
jgi:hypothetical protein